MQPLNAAALNHVQSTHACASGYRVRQSRGCHLCWNDPSVLPLNGLPGHFAALPRPRFDCVKSMFYRLRRVPERNSTRSGACMSYTYMRIAPTRILFDVKSSQDTQSFLM
jgi:hypothetical protein